MQPYGKWLATTSLQALCITKKVLSIFSSSKIVFILVARVCTLVTLSFSVNNILKSMPVGAWSVAMAESMCCRLVGARREVDKVLNNKLL